MMKSHNGESFTEGDHETQQDVFFGELDQEALALIKSFDSKPDLKPITKYGVFLWWSDQLPTWIHPDDLDTARRLVPGYRVFRREMCDGFADRELGFAKLCYGQETFRALPIIWLEVDNEGLEIGDQVEIKSAQGRRRPGIATLTDMTWNRHRRKIEYQLSRNGMPLRSPFLAEELMPAIRLGHHLNQREILRRESLSLR